VNWLRVNRRVATVVALTLAVPALLVLSVVVRLCSMGLEFQGEIERLEPRIARLRGTLAAEEQLVGAAAEAVSSIGNLVYPAGDDPDTVAATLQKNVRGIMSDAGAVVADSQIEPVRREGAFDVVGLTVSVTGSIETLDSALERIAAFTPRLLVTDIDVTPKWAARRREAEPGDGQTLTVKMSLLSLVGVE
jgi:general secretion pathway protein M